MPCAVSRSYERWSRSPAEARRQPLGMRLRFLKETSGHGAGERLLAGEERGRIVLEPSRLKGPLGNPSFELLPDHAVELDDVVPEALGRSLRRLSKLREMKSVAG